MRRRQGKVLFRYEKPDMKNLEMKASSGWIKETRRDDKRTIADSNSI
jgi:hypothetical protein